MSIAITRDVPRSIAQCELTHVVRVPIELERARAQHDEYERALEQLGYAVRRLPELPDYPDSVFVEDVAIVLDDLCVLTRPGTESRRGEVDAIAVEMARYRPVVRMSAPATLDGGDVLRVGRTLFVGVSSRTTEAGVAQLRALVEPHGYAVIGVEVRGALHLKTAVTQVGPRLLVANREWVDTGSLGSFDVVDVDPLEPFGANTVYTPAGVIHSTAFPRTRERLERAGVFVAGVDATELAKAEGGVSCCSVLLP